MTSNQSLQKSRPEPRIQTTNSKRIVQPSVGRRKAYKNEDGTTKAECGERAALRMTVSFSSVRRSAPYHLELEAQTETVLINYPLPNGLAYSETEQGREEGETQ